MSKKIALIDYRFLTKERMERIRKVADEGGYTLQYFEDNKACRGQLTDFEILFGSVSRHNIREAVSAKWVCAGRVGVDTVCDPALYAQPDCILTNSPGVYAVSIAEHLIMTALMLLRKQYLYAEPMRRGEWGPEPAAIRSLKGSRIMVLGAGAIGTAFAIRAKSFEPASIIGVKRNSAKADPVYDRVVTPEELDSVLPETDILAMCLPNTSETKEILSAERIALLPPSAFVLNIGRGGCVDQAALTAALKDGRLAGAGLDVMTPEPLPADDPLRQMENVILTPHIAGIPNLDYSIDLIVDEFCEDLARYIKGEPLKYVIDMKRGY